LLPFGGYFPAAPGTLRTAPETGRQEEWNTQKIRVLILFLAGRKIRQDELPVGTSCRPSPSRLSARETSLRSFSRQLRWRLTGQFIPRALSHD
jgi:hypothetical protein